ncbi:MAG: DUF1572 family protein [Flavobacteriaceae bacterium]
MQVESYRKLYKTEIEKLKNEIELYKDEGTLWVIDKEIANSAGHLCLHLIGNLNHFIVFGFGKIGYLRDRELEFNSDDVPREHLVDSISETAAIVDKVLRNTTEENLQSDYPISKFEDRTSIEFVLVHLLAHLTYHIGQINYHRRIFDN